jgi:hypothetical protein
MKDTHHMKTHLTSVADVIGVIYAGIVLALVLTLAIWGVVGAPADFDPYGAGGGGNSNNTPADVIHPNIHQNNGAGNNANPNGANDGGGNMHGIANAQGGNGGVANLGNVHGGICSVNKNVTTGNCD